MDDLPKHSLTSMLQAVPPGVEKVYLPPGKLGQDVNSSAQSEAAAFRPEVAAAAQSYFESADALYNDRVPEATLLSERPIHRIMIWMQAQGASAADIAKQTKYSVASVRLVLRQPWARARLNQILKETGQDAVKFFLTHEVAPSLEVLRDIRDGNAKPADKIAATKEILDRCLGKSVAKIETDNTNRQVPAELTRIDEELAAVRKQLDEHGSGTN